MIREFRKEMQPNGGFVIYVTDRPSWWERLIGKKSSRSISAYPPGTPSITIDHYVEYWSIPE